MIYAERIRLRAVEREDIPRYVEWLNDPEVIAGLLIHIPMSTWDETRWFENLAHHSPETRPLAIEAKTSDGGWKHIGGLGFDTIEWTNSNAEFGIVIGEKSFWNQGYGTEATRLMLKYGFETLNLNRIFLRVYETNPRAIRAYEKVGFVKEGVLRQALYRNGRYINVWLMGVLRSEWNPTEEKKVKS
jgi:RimJ/RimL family protein N-acetyltransferase